MSQATIESITLNILHDCFARQRYYAARDLTASGKQYLFNLADAAHNLPLALAGEHGYSVEQPGFSDSLQKLKALLTEPVPNAEYLA